jgi:hypothetical protein
MEQSQRLFDSQMSDFSEIACDLGLAPIVAVLNARLLLTSVMQALIIEVGTN